MVMIYRIVEQVLQKKETYVRSLGKVMVILALFVLMGITISSGIHASGFLQVAAFYFAYDIFSQRD